MTARVTAAVSLHAISAVHAWWGVTFIRHGEIHPTFGGTAFFRDTPPDAQAWGAILFLVAVAASIGVHVREMWASCALALPQQVIILLAALHAIQTQMPRWDHPVSQLAGPYVIAFLVVHAASLVGRHGGHRGAL